MRERGRYQIQVMKSRSSTGVGMKVDLEYNIETMRITDNGEENQDHSGGPPRISSIMNQIKTSTTVSPTAKPGFDVENDAGPPPTATVESNKLKQMLAGLKAKE